jgi:preprotein translocase SecF subunit
MTFQFYQKRYIFFAISIAIILVGIIVTLISGGVKLDIQFQGGSIVRYSYEGEEIDNQTLSELSASIREAIQTEVSSIQKNTSTATGEKSISINVAVSGDRALSVAQTTAIEELLESERYQNMKFSILEETVVFPSIGREHLMKGIYALMISFLLIILYVWFSFRSMSGPSAGVMALVALFHDVVIVFVAYTLLRISINEQFIAVVLTIIGYSVNDTIVIYDRIRENLKQDTKGMSLSGLVNRSIHQSMSRTVNTSLATIAAMMVTYIFASLNGLQSIQQFALPMIIGLVSGFYSTVFIATPLWVMWKTRGNRAGI